ncbi:hypothetical protein GCM10011575_03300 [Microlunatus endophyticus]|uniref:DUF1707 domain-containing protein n=1 Tax=Microlunatus endophyticus TaxID=1716077 RepID=A0A917VZM6_9ACTN|nr:DUF1707 and DUF4870 domain-containing protein [Microlunatus endophyticus]GGL48681.1 hypothetical protein GCM10011575_03300 [Microlunatus endophyticus]
MQASYEHPSLRIPVTAEQRDRAADYLKAAYAEGRISEAEFDRRIGLVLGAATRKDLNDAFYGLVEPSAQATGAPYAAPFGNTAGGYGDPGPFRSYGSSLSQAAQNFPALQQGSAGGALAHFSGLFTSVLGPGIGYAASRPGSVARKESAKAFNFQLIALIALVVGGALQGISHSGLVGFLVGLGWVAWAVLTIVGGVKAAHGENWTNPVTKAVKLHVLPEK